MRIPSSEKGVMYFALIIAAALVVLPVSAQQQERTDETFEIEVIAPSLEVQESQTPWGGGSRVSMSQAVRFSDLDLGTARGRGELEERVSETANEICGLLADRYPEALTQVPRCTQEAIDDAMSQVQAAIEGA